MPEHSSQLILLDQCAARITRNVPGLNIITDHQQLDGGASISSIIVEGAKLDLIDTSIFLPEKIGESKGAFLLDFKRATVADLPVQLVRFHFPNATILAAETGASHNCRISVSGGAEVTISIHKDSIVHCLSERFQQLSGLTAQLDDDLTITMQTNVSLPPITAEVILKGRLALWQKSPPDSTTTQGLSILDAEITSNPRALSPIIASILKPKLTPVFQLPAHPSLLRAFRARGLTASQGCLIIDGLLDISQNPRAAVNLNFAEGKMWQGT